jgi:hypothetical protein
MSCRCCSPFRSSHPWAFSWILGSAILLVSLATAWTQDLQITEFMADNDFGIPDEDGELQDWIELYNPQSHPVALTGWHLTDDPKNLTQWTFPGGSIPARGFIVVFASGKDRREPPGPWHTNFRLAKDGEYLALVRPGGVTVSSEFAPQFPPQIPGASFGIGMTVERFPLVTESWPGRLHVPTDGVAAPDWILPGFNDSGWMPIQMGIGYERAPEDGADPGVPVADVTQPGDLIQPTSFNSPGGEGVEMAIDDNPGTKYLNFDKLNAGFTVTPAVGSTVVIGLRFTSANDAPERDPVSFTLEGSNDGSTFTAIASGAIPDFPARFYTVEVSFVNELSYQHYRLLFPSVRNSAAANSVQIAEVEFLGRTGPPPPVFAGLFNTDVEGLLFQRNASAWVRLPFNLPEGAPLEDLVLRVRYDDGFVAYMNGIQVALANSPTTPAFNSTALLDRPSEQAVRAETFPMADYAHLLTTGPNLLAFHALNDRSDSPHFLLGAELVNLRVTLGTHGFFAQPTPGEFNAERSQGRVAQPMPSLPRGFHPGPIHLSLSSDTPGATIRFTLDGRTPSPAIGHVYIGPIQLTTGAPLRAIAFKDGYIPSQITTHTYLILDEVIRQDAARAAARGFPSAWGSTPADYDMDPSMIGQDGQDIYGGRYAGSIREDLVALPSISLVMQLDDLFGPTGIYSNPENRGDAWERPVSFELFEPGDPAGGFQVDAGIRIQGGAFRRFDLTKKKSFRVVFRRTYGPSMLDYPLFGPDATARFNNFILRANSNDAWPYAGGNALYIRDAFAMETARAMGSVASHTRFAHLYINGLYWGLYNPVERPDAAFSASYHGGDRDTWDALNQDGLTHGTADAWNRLIAALNDDLSDNEIYQRIQGRNPDGTTNPQFENLLDVDNMIDYMILNLYIGNADWPHRNYWVGRDRAGTEGFQFYPWDSETALGFTGLHTDRTGVNSHVARPYAAARANAEFRMRFADRVHQHFSEGGVFYVNPAQPAWNPNQPENNVPAARVAYLASIVEAAMVGESARWGDQMGTGPYTRDSHWAAARDLLLIDYLPRRSAIVLDQFRAAGLYPRIEAPTFNQRGGQVERGFWLVLDAPEGTIHYTLDGSDPRRPVEVEVLSQTTLVSSTTPKRVLVPSVQNGGSTLGDTWRTVVTGFNDASWTLGTGGVGYDTDTTYVSYIGIDVRNAMHGINGSAFVRIPFTYDGTGLDRLNTMILRVRVDDGFAAYLNGVRIAALNAPNNPSWNSLATALNPDEAAVQFRVFDVTPHLASLRVGQNLLAIHGLNISTGSSDFLIDGELDVGEQRILGGDTTAYVYQGPLQLMDLTTIKARVLQGAEWSALSEATFFVGYPRRIITELHYHPAGPSTAEIAAGFTNANDFEFVELYNAGTGSMDLRGVRFIDGVTFDFTHSPFATIAPGACILLVQNRAAFEFRYGTDYPIAGEYAGRFSNSGERVDLVDAMGQTLVAFTYGSRFPWPSGPDGQGPSLTLADLDADPSDPSSWLASESWGGTPGRIPPSTPLRIEHVSFDGSSLTLAFTALAGKTYTIRRRDDLAGTWLTVQTIPAAPTTGLRQVELPWDPALPNVFFQLVQSP